MNIERSEVRFGTTMIGYRVVRSAKRATVSIAIDPEGVLVTAPRPASMQRLDRIVHAKASWIVQRLRRRSDLPPAPSMREFVSGETFLYLGRQHRLLVDIDDDPRPLRLEGGWLRIATPRHLQMEHRQAFVRASMVDWYKRRAAKRLVARAEVLARGMHRPAPAIVLVESRRRWGSAAASGAIRINWRIIQAPLSLVDYVIAHELTHLAHPNHTRAFWSALGRVMPDYDTRKAVLRTLGPRLDW